MAKKIHRNMYLYGYMVHFVNIRALPFWYDELCERVLPNIWGHRRNSFLTPAVIASIYRVEQERAKINAYLEQNQVFRVKR